MSQLADQLREIRAKTATIKSIFEATGTIHEEDLEFLCDSAVRYVITKNIAETDWIKLKTLQATSSVEIEELKRQLDNPDKFK